MKIVYSDRYRIDIGTHVFATAKYQLVRAALLASGVSPGDFVSPEPASWEDLGLVHTPEYLDKLREGRLSLGEIAEMELPWSPGIVEGYRLMAGGTILAARLAVACREPAQAGEARPEAPWRAVVHLGGGFHHAFCNHGEGFCMFNDVAVAIRMLKRDYQVTRAAVVDCDVHDGNGTAMIFTGDRSVFTFSMHQQHNYPVFKPPGSLDIGLDDGTDDATYLSELQAALPAVFERRPDVLFYLAGADPFEDDQLGGLALTRDGLRRRDRVVLEAARQAGVPVVVTLAGGYARHLQDTVAIHVATVEEARAVCEEKRADLTTTTEC